MTWLANRVFVVDWTGVSLRAVLARPARNGAVAIRQWNIPCRTESELPDCLMEIRSSCPDSIPVAAIAPGWFHSTVLDDSASELKSSNPGSRSGFTDADARTLNHRLGKFRIPRIPGILEKEGCIYFDLDLLDRFARILNAAKLPLVAAYLPGLSLAWFHIKNDRPSGSEMVVCMRQGVIHIAALAGRKLIYTRSVAGDESEIDRITGLAQSQIGHAQGNWSPDRTIRCDDTTEEAADPILLGAAAIYFRNDPALSVKVLNPLLRHPVISTAGLRNSFLILILALTMAVYSGVLAKTDSFRKVSNTRHISEKHRMTELKKLGIPSGAVILPGEPLSLAASRIAQSFNEVTGVRLEGLNIQYDSIRIEVVVDDNSIGESLLNKIQKNFEPYASVRLTGSTRKNETLELEILIAPVAAGKES